MNHYIVKPVVCQKLVVLGFYNSLWDISEEIAAVRDGEIDGVPVLKILHFQIIPKGHQFTGLLMVEVPIVQE